ncbi:MAG: alpha/beta hydrolase, partial [Shimia sp.]
MRRALPLVLALAASLAALLWLEAMRPAESARETLRIGATPATLWRAEGPVVVVAHGFAGSRRLMNAYTWSLHRAGFTVLAFDFQGHGAHPVPMGGDVDAIEGTTRRLVDQTLEVIDTAATLDPRALSLLGHSMATDVLIRAAAEARAPIGPIVALSPFSDAVTPTFPRALLTIAGEWEGRLVAFGDRALAQVDPEAARGALARAGEVTRRTIVAPNVEHVGILYSPTALRAATGWT